MSRVARASTIVLLLTLAACGGGSGGNSTQQPLFVIPQNTGGYFPNPANLYMAAAPLTYKAGRIIVVRGKAPVFPDTYVGESIFVAANPPGPIQLRYWSMCNNIEEAPYPVVLCRADYATALDADGFYTYVMSYEPSDTQPDWVPPDATWLPWGATDEPNILILRNMLPYPGFTQAVQNASAAGCTIDNQQGVTTPNATLRAASQCAAGVMGPYYPRIAYCAQDLFIEQGWQGCFDAAGVD
ncbi:MAG: hypothetical protein SF182_18405 [Deltaproteobacteria bacterium]|nr:hypothetical protein [Deltaproteobacteria bacterium]